MIEDMRHLEMFAAHAQEVADVIVRYNECINGVTDKAELVRLRLNHVREMISLLERQARALRFMAGEKIEPEMHFGEAVLVGIGGQQ